MNSVTNPPTQSEQRKNNRRVGIVLALLAMSVFVSVIFRQWVDGKL